MLQEVYKIINAKEHFLLRSLAISFLFHGASSRPCHFREREYLLGGYLWVFGQNTKAKKERKRSTNT